jgi:hypothetical protein
MSEEITKENTRPYKSRDYESYLLWKSLPSVLRGQPSVVLEKMGIDEEVSIELLSIKTQKEFASRFGIKDEGTLSDWNKRIEKEGLLDQINAWSRKLTPNIIFALYKNASKNGKAHEVRTWMEIIENR